jgi:hypothetical protein
LSTTPAERHLGEHLIACAAHDRGRLGDADSRTSNGTIEWKNPSGETYKAWEEATLAKA